MVNATPLARVGAPTPEEAGFVDIFETIEIGGDRVTVIRQLVDGDEGYDPTVPGERTKTATIVLRGATSNRLDDLERAIDDGVNVIKALLKDPRMVPGAGATEIELAKRADAYGSGLKGLSQHAVKRYASALEVVPRTLAENALGGAEGNEVLSRLWAKHEQKGGENWGVDVEVGPNAALTSGSIVVLTNFRASRTGRCWPTKHRFMIHSRQRRGRFSWARKLLSQCSLSTVLS